MGLELRRESPLWKDLDWSPNEEGWRGFNSFINERDASSCVIEFSRRKKQKPDRFSLAPIMLKDCVLLFVQIEHSYGRQRQRLYKIYLNVVSLLYQIRTIFLIFVFIYFGRRLFTGEVRDPILPGASGTAPSGIEAEIPQKYWKLLGSNLSRQF